MAYISKPLVSYFVN